MAGPLKRPNPSPSTSRPRRPSSTTAPATGSTWTTSSGSGFEEWPRYSIGRTASLSSCTECQCGSGHPTFWHQGNLRLYGHLHRSRLALDRRDHARKGVGSNGGTPVT